MTSIEAVIAANRFGLGARPGDLRRIGGDPRGWLLAQLVPETSLPEPLAALPSTAEDQAAFFVWLRRFGKRAREASAQRNSGEATTKANGSDAATTAPKSVPSGEPASDMNSVAAPTRNNGQRVANVEQSYAQTLLPRYQAALEARFATAVASETPFRERLMRFWSNHFVVSAAKRAAIALPPSYERDVARRYFASDFATLLRAAEQHPAMLLYLDNAQSIGPNSRWGSNPELMPRNRAIGKLAPGKSKGLNENLAREILELHTLGVNGGYTQTDVTAFARAITGWQIANPLRQFKFKRFSDWTPEDFFYFNPAAHEPGVQQLLGRTYPQEGVDQGRAVLADLARHPATATFIATKLARHFVADVPPASLVERLSRTFRGSDGDLPSVYRALVNSPEAWAGAAVKFKQPEEHVVSALRGLDGPMLNGKQLFVLLNEMGQRPYWQPGPNGWPDGQAEWLAPDALWKRLEFATMVGNRMANAARKPALIAEELLGPTLSEHTRDAIGNADTPAQGLALLLSSPDFLRR